MTTEADCKHVIIYGSATGKGKDRKFICGGGCFKEGVGVPVEWKDFPDLELYEMVKRESRGLDPRPKV